MKFNILYLEFEAQIRHLDCINNSDTTHGGNQSCSPPRLPTCVWGCELCHY